MTSRGSAELMGWSDQQASTSEACISASSYQKASTATWLACLLAQPTGPNATCWDSWLPPHCAPSPIDRCTMA
ncbi:MAG: hypothetical protein RR068_14570, partial [Hafnia sp.]